MSGGGTNSRSTRLLIGALSLLVSAVCVEMTLCVLGRIWLPVMLVAGGIGLVAAGAWGLMRWWRNRFWW